MHAFFPPAVMIHGRADAWAATAAGLPVTLLSAPGAGLYAGGLWWRSVIDPMRARAPVVDVLDCADAAGAALAALRAGVRHVVLWPCTPGRTAIVGIAQALGGCVLDRAPDRAPGGL